jgi:hypothetical protein
MKYLTSLKELTAGEMLMIAAVFITPMMIAYGLFR